MIRRVLSVFGLLSALASGPAALAADPITLRLSTAAIETDWLSKSLNLFRERLEASAPGQFKVQVFANGTLFRQGTEVAAIQRGNLEMSTMTTFEVEQQVPELSLFSAGYLFRDWDHARKVLSGPIGDDYRRRVGEVMGIEILEPLYLGTRQVNLRQARAVNVPADLNGLKLRMPGGPGWLVLGRAIGASPTPMAMPEVYLAMKTGAVDGQDNPLSITRANNLQEVSQQIVLTSHLVQPVFLSIARPVWAKLSPEGQGHVRAAAKAAAELNDRNRLAEEKELIHFFKDKGLQVTTPDVAAFQAAVRKAYLESDVSKPWPPGLWERVAAVR